MWIAPKVAARSSSRSSPSAVAAPRACTCRSRPRTTSSASRGLETERPRTPPSPSNVTAEPSSARTTLARPVVVACATSSSPDAPSCTPSIASESGPPSREIDASPAWGIVARTASGVLATWGSVENWSSERYFVRVRTRGPGPIVKATGSWGREIFQVSASTPTSAPSWMRSERRSSRATAFARRPWRSSTGTSGAAGFAVGTGGGKGPGGSGVAWGSAVPFSAARSMEIVRAAARARERTPARSVSPSPPSRDASANPSRACALATLQRRPSRSQTAATPLASTFGSTESAVIQRTVVPSSSTTGPVRVGALASVLLSVDPRARHVRSSSRTRSSSPWISTAGAMDLDLVDAEEETDAHAQVVDPHLDGWDALGSNPQVDEVHPEPARADPTDLEIDMTPCSTAVSNCANHGAEPQRSDRDGQGDRTSDHDASSLREAERAVEQNRNSAQAGMHRWSASVTRAKVARASRRTPDAGTKRKEPAPGFRLGGLFGSRARRKSRRRPTLPHGFPCSTIGSEELNFRVRDGIGCGLLEITTGNFVDRLRPSASRNTPKGKRDSQSESRTRISKFALET